MYITITSLFTITEQLAKRNNKIEYCNRGLTKELRNVNEKRKCRWGSRGKDMHRAVRGTNDLQNYVKNIAWKRIFVRNIAAVWWNTRILYFVYDIVLLDLLRIFATLLLLQLFQVSIIICCTNGPIRRDWEACAKGKMTKILFKTWEGAMG